LPCSASAWPGAKKPADTPDRITTDGETFDRTALAAAHQTVPLPAILRVTNLETGRQILVRANDRGPSTPHRLIQLTQHAAERLGIDANRPTAVRVTLEDGPTAAMVEALGGRAPKLAMSTAPVADVQVEDLTTHRVTSNTRSSDDEQKTSFAVDQAVPDRVWHVPPAPMPLWVEAGTFSQMRYAQMQRMRIGGSLQRIGGGRTAQYRVRLGPFSGAGEADAALDRAMRAGVTDARIVAAEP
jgi:rare lipoprotein A